MSEESEPSQAPTPTDVDTEYERKKSLCVREKGVVTSSLWASVWRERKEWFDVVRVTSSLWASVWRERKEVVDGVRTTSSLDVSAYELPLA